MMQGRTYTFKGLHRNNLGSIRLVNMALSRFSDEMGLTPAKLFISELRRQTLPEIQDGARILSNGLLCEYIFDAGLALNQVYCEGITPIRIMIILSDEYSIGNCTHELKKLYKDAQVKVAHASEMMVTLNQESWDSRDELNFAYLHYAVHCLHSWWRIES